MTRYFYPASRAHHAVCMALDHGAKFRVAMKNGLIDFEIGNLKLDIGLVAAYLRDKDFAGRFYVEHDSLPLLCPRVRDSVELDGRDQAEIVVQIAGLGSEVGSSADFYSTGLQYFDRDEILRVIERAGKPFHTPESEELC